MYMCIGKNPGVGFLKNVARGLVESLPDTVRLVESGIEVDGHWVAWRVITRMPIELG